MNKDQHPLGFLGLITQNRIHRVAPAAPHKWALIATFASINCANCVLVGLICSCSIFAHPPTSNQRPIPGVPRDPNAPQIVDPNQPGTAIQLPKIWEKLLENNSSNARVLTQDDFLKEFGE